MNKFLFYSTGKKKTSIARIFLNIGSGIITINKKTINSYCNNNYIKINNILYPLKILNLEKIFDLFITVKGGGVSSQIYAIKHGISKILILYNIEYKKILKENKLITRDSRIVERKKYGFKKSRKKSQFSKR